MSDPMSPIVTEAEAEQLIRVNLAATTKENPTTEQEAAGIWEWAEETRVRAALLQLALNGEIGLRFTDGEVRAARLTDRGREWLDAATSRAGQ